MKKTIMSMILCISIISTVLSGCGEVVTPLAEADYILSDENVTTKDIRVGNTLEELIAAYGSYPLLISDNGVDYSILTEEVILTSNPTNIILSDFIVDQAVMSQDSICETYQIEKENLLSTLDSEDFLSSHTVLYRYISFDLKDGIIVGLASDCRDFNAELTYDKDHSK